MQSFEQKRSTELTENTNAEAEKESEKSVIQDEVIKVEGELVGNEATDSIIRTLENSKLRLDSLKDSVLRTERGSHISIGEISDSIVRFNELTDAVIGEINDAVIRIKAGANVKVRRASNCLFHLAEGATLNIEENIDSVVGGLGEFTQNKNNENGDVQKAEAAEKKLEDVRKQLEQI